MATRSDHQPSTPKIPMSLRRKLSVAAGVDPRTIVQAYAAALDPSVSPPRGMAGERAMRALVEAGLLPDPSSAPRAA